VSTSAPTRNPQQSATALFNDVQSTSAAIERGDWLSAGMGATNVAMDVIGLGGDPLGAISSAGFGWLIGHIKFLREPFDALANTAEQYRTATSQQTSQWTGAAGDAYRAAGDTQARNLDSLSKVSKAVSDALAGAGKALAEARKAVIDMVNQACNKIIMIIIEALAEAWGSFGASIAKGIAQSVQTAVSAAQKMLTKIQKLVSTLQKIISLVQKVVQLAQAVKQILETVGGNANPGSDQTVRPTGQSVDYAGDISGRQGIGPSGANESVTLHATDPGRTYHGFGELPANVPSWGPSGPPPDRGYAASRVDQARWIGSAVQVLIEHGVDPSRIDTGRIAELVNQGSGGNPHAVNLNDPSAQHGYPPKGLMQLTDPVFEQHRLPSHTDIWQPVDNLAAGILFQLAQLSQVQQGSSRPVR
jgi:uncharacterized protein YukE